MRNFISIFTLVAIITLLFAPVLVAAETKTTTFDGGENIIVTEPLESNYYAAADQIEINANASQDVLVTAASVIVRGDVQGNLFVAAGEAQVDGEVGGDIFLAVGNAVINGNVQGDIRVVAGQLFVNSQSVGGDLMVAAGVTGLNKESVVGGKQMITSGQKTTTAADNPTSIADITGTQFQVQSIVSSLQGVGIVAGIVSFIFGILYLIGGVVANYFLLRTSPVIAERTIVRMKENPGVSILIGLGVFVFAPILAFVLLISGIGHPLLFVLVIVGILSIMLANAYSTYLVGRLTLKQLKYDKTGRLIPLATGSLILFVTYNLPFVGWLVGGFGSILLPAWGVGALAYNKWEKVRNIEIEQFKRAKNTE